MPNSPDTQYGVLAKVLHWANAAFIIGLLGLGWYMVDLSYFDRWYNAALSTHKSLGVLALGAACFSLLWRIHSPAPPLVATIKPWEGFAAKTVHRFLYVMMVAIPISGYLISTSTGEGVSVFGWFVVPALVPLDERSRDMAIAFHYYLAYGTAGVVLLHAAAAFKHQFIDKDGTLRRMLW